MPARPSDPRRLLELTWSDNHGREGLRVRGWTAAELRHLRDLAPAELGGRLAVLPSALVETGLRLSNLQPLAGRFEIEGDDAWFFPRFPFQEGTAYSLLVNLGPNYRPLSEAQRSGLERASGVEVWPIQRPVRTATPATEVLAIYPSGAELPVNQLKLYVHFSAPMSEGWAARAIQMRRADNNEVLPDVFLAGPELWDPERRRLTLLLDPGRIKRGLAPNEEAGYPLIEGVPVIVNVGREIRDAAGQPLLSGAARRYAVGPAVRSRVRLEGWRYRYPAVGSLDAFTVEFDRPLDHALLQHCLGVHDAAGAPLKGRISVLSGERCWRFEPRSPWQDARYVLAVDPRLEDLAGNSLQRVFDRDLEERQDSAPSPFQGEGWDGGESHAPSHVAIEFRCR